MAISGRRGCQIVQAYQNVGISGAKAQPAPCSQLYQPPLLLALIAMAGRVPAMAE